MAACICTERLSKRYGATAAVSELTFDVQLGEVVGLLGANGAGKSTTLYMLSGLVAPTSGSVSMFGRDLRRQLREVLPRVGVLTERPSFFDYLTARQNLRAFAELARRNVTIDRALDRAGLLRAANRRVGTFSLGMRQRLGIAQALLTDPELLLLDEPTSGLDPETTQDVLRLLRALAEDSKVTILFSSHVLQEVEVLADRVAVLNHGRLIACERTERLIAYDPHRADVLVDAPEAAASRLNEQDWVESAVALPDRVRVVLSHESIHHLTHFLLTSGFVLSGVIPHRRSLQDYFVKMLNP